MEQVCIPPLPPDFNVDNSTPAVEINAPLRTHAPVARVPSAQPPVRFTNIEERGAGGVRSGRRGGRLDGMDEEKCRSCRGGSREIPAATHTQPKAPVESV